MVVLVSVPSMSQIDRFKSYSYSTRLCAPPKPQRQLHNKCKYECTMNAISWLLGMWNNPKWVNMLLKPINYISELRLLEEV